MTYHGPPPPLPWTPWDLLEGPILLSACVVIGAIMGFFSVGLLAPAPLAVLGALGWYDQRQRRNRQRGQGHPPLLTHLWWFAVLVYLAYGLGSAIADQTYL
ncbi:hypothetical protein [Ancylobacter defluvii]|uniref:Uncharacterized protein n=1 Tax=Ancylobacter defluvii TaxID=1282440 RepID=A0A9W6JXE2_9HYPH|nr:hypothetical protein [Ancylobacter defluvii]MBS7588771.1 hypothetical protein [Ancylobacter defluvii]GLK84059.1 hypothetical protein GCM10017653_21290 [Ancylobacter defluvii]